MFKQTQNLSGLALETDRDYWQRKLAGNLPIIDLPCDRPRQFATNNYESHCFELGAEVIELLEQFSFSKNVSIELILLATFHPLTHMMYNE